MTTQIQESLKSYSSTTKCSKEWEISRIVKSNWKSTQRLPLSHKIVDDFPTVCEKKVNEKLKEMEEQYIIEKVDGVTPWLSPLIPIPKKGGDLRLVLDMRVPNQALERRRVQFPTVDDILHKMQGSTIFTEVLK